MLTTAKQLSIVISKQETHVKLFIIILVVIIVLLTAILIGIILIIWFLLLKLVIQIYIKTTYDKCLTLIIMVLYIKKIMTRNHNW